MQAYLRRLVCMTVLLHFLGGLLILETAFSAEEQPFHCHLALPGDETSPAANASFQTSASGQEIHYSLRVRNLSNITMAHLHLGLKEGISTPVVWLYPPSPPPKLLPGSFDGVLAEGTITAKDLVGPLRGKPLSALIREMEAGNTYVNVHTKEHPEGSICGQVELSVK